MVIALNSEQAQVVDRAVQAGLIRSAEDVVEAGAEAHPTAIGSTRARNRRIACGRVLQEIARLG